MKLNDLRLKLHAPIFGNDLKLLGNYKKNIVDWVVLGAKILKYGIKTSYYKNKFNLGKNVIIGDRCEFKNPQSIEIGDNTHINDDCILQSWNPNKINLIIKENCYLNKRVSIFASNLVSIGKNVMISRHVVIEDFTHKYTDVNKSIKEQGFVNDRKGGSIIIEDDCWIGQGVAIFSKDYEIRIGKHSIIGANTVVRKSIPPYSVVFGIPAKIIKRYDFKKKKWVKVRKNIFY